MRFMFTLEGAERLAERHQFDADRACWTSTGNDRERREFAGPSVREGLLGGFTRGEVKWAKQQLKIMVTEQLDLMDCRLLYYVLSIRRAPGAQAHKLLPIDWFDDLALDDFQLVRHHVEYLDQDGDCGECTMAVGNRAVHYQPEPGAPGADELPPTTAPDGPETTGTATD
jgi:hypothetical protein